MQPNLYETVEDVPNLVERSVDKVLLGASHYRLDAENSGNLYLVLQNGGSFRFAKATFPNGRFLFFQGLLKSMFLKLVGKSKFCKFPQSLTLIH